MLRWQVPRFEFVRPDVLCPDSQLVASKVCRHDAQTMRSSLFAGSDEVSQSSRRSFREVPYLLTSPVLTIREPVRAGFQSGRLRGGHSRLPREAL